MKKFEIHQRENKIRLLKKFRADFILDFNLDPGEGKGFTRSEYFHFGEIDKKKYVHKEALRFALTNGGTYFLGVEALENFKVNSDEKLQQQIDLNIDKLFDCYRNDLNNYKIYPTFLGETEHFFIFDYYSLEEWDELEALTLNDAKLIRKALDPIYSKNKIILSPFHNQMFKKILRNKNTGEIKCRDLKNLEFRAPAPLGILFYNGYVNIYYQLERRFRSREYILREYAIDYPVKSTKIEKLY